MRSLPNETVHETPARAVSGMPAPGWGTLYGVGVGPGDPELLTLKAVRVLQTVPVVFVPVARPAAPSLAQSIAAAHLDAQRQRIEELVFAMRDDVDVRSTQWYAHAEVIARRLSSGDDAAFITEGDPLLYSTFVHVATALASRYPEARIEIVPGVSSVNAAAAVAGVPLVDGNERLAVVPVTSGIEYVRRALLDFDTVVVLKVSGAVDQVLDLLDEMGGLTEAVLVTRAGQPGQRVEHDLGRLRGHTLDYFSLLIVRRRP